MDGGGYDGQKNQLRSSLNDRYKLYLRHYLGRHLETVTFFILLAREGMGADL